jgi:hypothetical protein
MGVDAKGIPHPANGTGSSRDSVGFPIRGQFYRKFTYADANKDGYIVASEVTVDPNFSFIGSPNPKNTLSLANTFSLFSSKLRINSQFDYKGDYFVLNTNGSFRCVNLNASAERSNPNASLKDQADCVAARATSITTAYGYLESGEFVRFRELSATYSLPQQFLKAVHTQRASLSAGARNLALWTKYRGQDPEANYGATDVQQNLASSAPRTQYTVRLNVFF